MNKITKTILHPSIVRRGAQLCAPTDRIPLGISIGDRGERGNRGFTLIELIVVVVIIGVLSAIAAPSWVAFVDGRRLSVAQDQILRSLQAAQSNARRDKVIWQVSFREHNGVAQWIVLPASTNPTAVTWQNLDAAVRIVDPIVNANDPDGTTLEFDPTHNLWRMQFNYRGEANSPLGKIAIATRNGGQRWSCVKIATLLGAIRSASDENCLD
ncbi:prepilin-type N-terminal cleavage/methylation domain-containing protein [Chroococcidiopsidales cyanobacterium LEGE 13417]|nr:prepilin-type N-terminal cleavage/methylation domain-containing protein [Chroococcidiopsidales cyanobacterium LEGE 13417]